MHAVNFAAAAVASPNVGRTHDEARRVRLGGNMSGQFHSLRDHKPKLIQHPNRTSVNVEQRTSIYCRRSKIDGHDRLPLLLLQQPIEHRRQEGRLMSWPLPTTPARRRHFYCCRWVLSDRCDLSIR